MVAGRSTVIALTALAPVSWGTTYAVTTEFLPADRPLFTGLMRALPAGLLLLAIARVLPRGAWWWKAAALGALNIGAFFPLLFLSAYRLPGGMAAAVGSVGPLIVVGLSALLLGAAPHRPVRAHRRRRRVRRQPGGAEGGRGAGRGRRAGGPRGHRLHVGRHRAHQAVGPPGRCRPARAHRLAADRGRPAHRAARPPDRGRPARAGRALRSAATSTWRWPTRRWRTGSGSAASAGSPPPRPPSSVRSHR